MTDSKIMLKITTVQTGAFKSLIEALNNILVDCNIECFPEEEGKESYMKILAVNNQSGMLVHMKLHSFDEFICTSKQTIGISIQLFYKIIKTITISSFKSRRTSCYYLYGYSWIFRQTCSKSSA